MIWRVEFTSGARKEIDRLPAHIRRRVQAFLTERAAQRDNPRDLAKRLVSAGQETWRFRVGEHRIVFRFQSDRMIILVIGVGNRRDIYR